MHWKCYTYYMLKNILIAGVAVVIFNAIFVFSGGLDLLVKTEQQVDAPVRTLINTDVVDVFHFTLEDEVRKKNGQPIEGYLPEMFIAVFPGLVETDFQGVQASLGVYTIQDGRLTFVLDETDLIHSAAQAITRDGYKTLLQNISNRIGIDLLKDGTITDIMSSITS